MPFPCRGVYLFVWRLFSRFVVHLPFINFNVSVRINLFYKNDILICVFLYSSHVNLIKICTLQDIAYEKDNDKKCRGAGNTVW